MISFDEWLKNKGQPASNFLRREAFEAGQESQQQKIDDLNNQLLVLQKRLNDTEKWIEENKKWIALGHSEGWTDEQYVDADDLLEVLKGENK